MQIDYDLIREARQFITGANVHGVRTWIFYYETLPDSPRRKKYEKALRDFVSSVKAVRTVREQAMIAADFSRAAQLRSDALNRRIENLLKRSSD